MKKTDFPIAEILANWRRVTIRSLATLLLMLSATVFGDAIYVTQFDDHNDGVCDSDCTLREAIDKTNQSSVVHTIYLKPGRYSIDIPPEPSDQIDGKQDEDKNVNGDFDILHSVNIIGLSKSKPQILGNGHDRIFDVITGDVLLKNLVVSSGTTRHHGGAIQNKSTLTLWYFEFIDNSVSFETNESGGGAIANFGTLYMNATLLDFNIVRGGWNARARGGGIYNAGKLIIRESRIINNSAYQENDYSLGGGLYNYGYADIRRSLFEENTVSNYGQGGAIYNAGHLDLYSSTFRQNNSGVELYTAAIANSTAWVDSQAFLGKVHIYNTTIVGNINGGFFSYGDSYLQNVIIAGNTGYGYRPRQPKNCLIDYVEEHSHRLNHVILGTGNNFNCEMQPKAEIILIDDGETFTSLLEPLTENGGPMRTVALRPGSIAIDSGENRCPFWDQNGNPSPIDGDGDGIANCDIGAEEYQSQ